MEIVCMGQPFGKKEPKMNTCLKAAGFDRLLLDFTLFWPEDISNFHLPELNINGWITNIAKAPVVPKEKSGTDLDELLYQLTMESINVSKRAGADYIIIDPIVIGSSDVGDIERNKDFYLSFTSIAMECGIKILIKNSYDIYNGHFVRGALSDRYQMAEFVDDLNESSGSEVFGVCMDVGVCNLLGQNMYDFCEHMGGRIKAVIIRENDGIKDVSLLPFTAAYGSSSSLDWLNLIRGLRLARFDGTVVFDFADTLHAHSHLLWPELCRMAKTTADYLLWQLNIENVIRKYDKRVLFGAGNMCRNYMKCYGEEYPPMFTCDNNSNIWGTMFEGLEIKSPEALKSIPKDCPVFICNMYYDEIEKQLFDMGITNPIERFCDEYLPSMYMDRFDADKREVRK